MTLHSIDDRTGEVTIEHGFHVHNMERKSEQEEREDVISVCHANLNLYF